MAPGMQFMPVAMRAGVGRRWPLADNTGWTRQEAVRQVLGVELLDRTQMRHYFPTSVLRTEKVLGVPKSLIAYRTGAGELIPPGDR
jgi:hypothetical protein